MAFTPRQGVLGRLLKYKEDTWGDDPNTTTNPPVLVPMSGPEQVRIAQPLNPATIYDGRRTSKGSWLGMIDDSGDVPTSLDYNYVGHDLITHLGSVDADAVAVYSRVGSLHRWVGMGIPISFQLQKHHKQTTAIYHRHRGLYSTIMRWAPAAAGQAMYTMSHMGKGDEVRTDLGGTVTDYAPFQAYNYFNSSILLQGTALEDAIGSTLVIDNKITREDAFSHGGQAAAVSFDTPEISGDLGRIFSLEIADTFYDLAVNETIARLECVYFNLPPASGPTAWLRYVMPAVRFSRNEAGVGGGRAENQTQHWVAQVPTTDEAAHSIGTVAGSGSTFTFTVPASSHFYVKIDGGSVLDIPITAGTRTLAQVVTQINADSGFTAVATATAWNGHLRIDSKSTVAATSKVQGQAGTGNTQALFGFDTTIWSGYPASMLYTELYNTKTADY